jgi:phospholipid/cholesterol/gamma-HCH transport system ATP-binding protein
MRIEIRDLHKSFGDLHVLRGLSLDIAEGELVVILGGSGQGKSVLLKLITMLIRPDSGSIRIDGEEITHLSESQLIKVRQRFGMIFQGGGLLQSLSVYENLALGLQELTMATEDIIRATVAEKLALVGLSGRESQDVSTLSGGQRKRVAIARALTMKCDCLLLDEPTAGLDPPTSANVDEIIEEVNEKQGVTGILVTHDLVSALKLGTRLVMLHNGQLIAQGTPEEFIQSTNPLVVRFLERDLHRAVRGSTTSISVPKM